MRNKLWVFGCSMSNKNQPKDRLDYVNWKGYVIKTWSELLSEKLNFELRNYGISGASNITIMHEFSKYSNEMHENDIVIINWTEITRFRVASKDKWLNVLVQHINHPDLKDELKVLNDNDISQQTIMDITNNRNNDLYLDELDSWYNLIKVFCNKSKIKLFFWGLMTYRPYMLKYKNFELQEYIVNHYGRIMEETKGEVMDGHFSEIAHKECSDIFFNLIQNEES